MLTDSQSEAYGLSATSKPKFFHYNLWLSSNNMMLFHNNIGLFHHKRSLFDNKRTFLNRRSLLYAEKK